ncbi:conditioned medium-induced protein 4 [Halostagnicola bangensis]
MNEKTEELRDLFTSVTDGEETVTESQTASRGSLEKDERTIDERVENVVTQMRERYEFDTPLTDEELIDVAKEFYEGTSDEEIASELDATEESIFEARASLHLVDDVDADEVDLVAIRERDEDPATIASEYDASEEQIRRYRRIASARDESRAANDRYRDEFDSVLADSDLTDRMASDVREDGLEDATEGMETDVSL